MNRKRFARDEYVAVGVFGTRLTVMVTEELNRRKIPHHLEEVDGFTTRLYALPSMASEASEVIDEITRTHPRHRF